MARMRYEHGLERDLFISYSHVDSREPEKWVDALETRLQTGLDEVTGKEIRIFRDARELLPGHKLDRDVMKAAESSAVFLMIIGKLAKFGLVPVGIRMRIGQRVPGDCRRAISGGRPRNLCLAFFRQAE